MKYRNKWHTFLVSTFHNHNTTSFCSNKSMLLSFFFSQNLGHSSCSGGRFLLYLCHNVLAMQLTIVNYSNYPLTKRMFHNNPVPFEIVGYINFCGVISSPRVGHKLPHAKYINPQSSKHFLQI
jgi:hypothetical protein